MWPVATMPGGIGLGDYSYDMRTKKVGQIVVGYGRNGQEAGIKNIRFLHILGIQKSIDI